MFVWLVQDLNLVGELSLQFSDCTSACVNVSFFTHTPCCLRRCVAEASPFRRSLKSNILPGWMHRPHIKASDRNRTLTLRMSSLTDQQNSHYPSQEGKAVPFHLLFLIIGRLLSLVSVCFLVTVSGLYHSFPDFFFPFLPPSWLIFIIRLFYMLHFQHWKHTTDGFPFLVFLTYVFGHTRCCDAECFWLSQLLLGCGCNVDLDGPVMCTAGPVCGAQGVYICLTTAALLIWFYHGGDVMMACVNLHHWQLQVSAAVLIFLWPW